tara:strand:- start:140 stop:916 length:777 start_codon:yes stop_codon:yes gene_type:complete
MQELPDFHPLQDVNSDKTPQSIRIDVNSTNSNYTRIPSKHEPPNSEPESRSLLLYIMIICSFILAPVSVIEEVWLTQTIDRDVWGDTVFTQEVHVGLRQVMYETCVDGTDCEYTDQEDFDVLHDMCMDDIEGDDEGESYDEEEIDEYCGIWSDLYIGGITTTVLIILAAVMLFAAFFMQGRPDTIEKSNFIAMGAGGLIILSLIFWSFMLPDEADNLDWGRGPWFALLAAGLSIAAGFIGNKRLKDSVTKDIDDLMYN